MYALLWYKWIVFLDTCFSLILGDFQVSFLFGLLDNRVVSHFSWALTFAAIRVGDPPILSFNPPLPLSSDTWIRLHFM
jgi:hypothetical protein